MIDSSGADIDDHGTVARHVARSIGEIRRSPVVQVPVAALLLAGSPRVRGEDPGHVRLLGEQEDTLPPIVVHRATMRVVDGAHRVRAALLRGVSLVGAQFFDGREDEVFVLSVALNAGHGLPLSRSDRTSAARFILTSHPFWSDRSVATVAGVSAATVARLRKGVAGATTGTRIGHDGRARPVNSTEGRARASEMLRRDPTASLRQVARTAGISPATAADVRDRLLRGADPLPDRLRRAVESERRTARRSAEGTGGAAGDVLPSPEVLTQLAESLRRDPSLRLTESGREILRLLGVCTAAMRERRRNGTSAVPPHCLDPLAKLMRGYSEIWQSFAAEFEQAHRARTRDPVA
ncbi:transcriptional regulator [Streptomyces zaomyceticus]|uniref:transcriptional regulator n=1 Tax=Streptomyces zaomyceticus TaxID=68286 RepID=UPI0036A2D97B